MVRILSSIALCRLRFSREGRQQRSLYGKINRTHARNTEYPALPEHSSRRDA